MSITGEAGGEQWGDAGSSPSISGKQGMPATSVASSSARLEVPMVGEAGIECASSGAAAGLRRLEMPRRRQKAAMEDSEGRASPSGMEPSDCMSLKRELIERYLSRWGSGDTMGKGSAVVPFGEGLVGNGTFGP